MDVREQLILELERARHGYVAAGLPIAAHGAEPHRPPALGPVRLTSPACGDEVTVKVLVSTAAEAGGIRILGLNWSGHGCTVSMASASALAVLLPGTPAGEYSALFARFDEVVRDDDALRNGPIDLADPADALGRLDALAAETGLGPAVAFAGIGRLPLRAGCATLAWRAVTQALDG